MLPDEVKMQLASGLSRRTSERCRASTSHNFEGRKPIAEPVMSEEFELSVGSKVRITSGPFQRFTGTITEIDQQSRLVKVQIDIFGRPEPVEFNFSDIVKE